MDEDMIYDQNFYICITEEAAEAELAKFATGGGGEGGEGGEGEAAEEEEPAEPRPREIVDPDPVNRPWVEWAPAEPEEGQEQKKDEKVKLTSEEIEGFLIKDVEGPKLEYAFSRRRNLFAQGPGKFHDADHIEVEDFKPYRDPQFKEHPDHPGVFGQRFILTDTATQCVPEHGDGTSQTPRFRLVNSMVQYAPIVEESNKGEAEVQAEEESLMEMLNEMVPLAEAALQTNETISVFVDDLSNLGDEETLGNTSDNKIKEYSSPFTDINYSKNTIISAIDWMPDSKGTVAVACVDKSSMDEQVEMDGKVRTSHILIWNFRDPIHPQFVLKAPGDIHSFKFNPDNNDLLAAGCANGQVLYWDLKAAKSAMAKKDQKEKAGGGSGEDGVEGSKGEDKTIKAAMMSTIEGSHRRAVAALQWLPPKKEVAPRTGNITPSPLKESKQIITLAADGMLLFWDLTVTKPDKNGALLWTPIYRIMMTSLEGAGDLGGCQLLLALEEEGEEAVKFVAATEDGELVHARWIQPEEEGATFVEKSTVAHYGPVVALERSPFFPDTLMTVGDWSFNVFRSASQEPILRSSFAGNYLTTGRFSPSRPGVMITGRSDGRIDVWDLMDRSHEPSLEHNVAPVAVTSMEFWSDPSGNLQLLAVGDGQGTLHVLEVPRNLRRPFTNEQGLVLALLDREVARVDYMRERMVFRQKELSVKEAEDEEKKRAADEAAAKAAGWFFVSSSFHDLDIHCQHLFPASTWCGKTPWDREHASHSTLMASSGHHHPRKQMQARAHQFDSCLILVFFVCLLAAADLAAREAAEAAAQALATGEGEAVEEEVGEEDGAALKLDKADEDEEARYRQVEADFKEKIGIKD